MDQQYFQQAQQAYEAGDYRKAASLFLTSAGKITIGNGEAFHLAGNSLMKIRRYQHAVTVYSLAIKDDTYRRRGAAYFNLGQAHAALGDYSEAAHAYEAALAEPGYETPYKAWQALAATLMDRGKIEQAASAYRQSAIDPANPAPGKALVNLGLCFMAMGRPSDAVDAYQAALGCDTLSSRGRALSNLGQALTSLGRYDEAVRAFDKAVQLHEQKLSPAALEAYETARKALVPSREIVEGWETGELDLVDDASSGWDTGELMSLSGPSYAPAVEPVVDDVAHPAEAAADALGFGDEAAVSEFFSLTEDQMRQRDREARRRRSGGGKSRLVRAIAVAAVSFVILVVSLVVLLSLGFGWPTQQSTVEGMLDAYKVYSAASKAEQVEAMGEVRAFWVADNVESEVKKEVEKISEFSSARIEDVERGARTSVVYVSVTREEGPKASYAVLLEREGVGWKVNGVLDEYEIGVDDK